MPVVETVSEEELQEIRKAAAEAEAAELVMVPEEPQAETPAEQQPAPAPAETAPAQEEPAPAETAPAQEEAASTEQQAAEPEETAAEPQPGPAAQPPEEQPAETPLPPQPAAAGGGRVIVLDPGHTALADSEKEPVGPGASELKLKDTGGTHGVATGILERDLVLKICMDLRTELQNRGYTVILTHETNNLKLSCSERAAVANQAGAAAFIRVHADGVNDGSVRGASAICITPGNPYTSSTYTLSRRLSDCVLGAYCEATGFRNRGVSETDTMSGNNWSQVPTTLVEMGFMTNAEEDRLMNDPGFQAGMVRGLADGIDRYFAQ